MYNQYKIFLVTLLTSVALNGTQIKLLASEINSDFTSPKPIHLAQSAPLTTPELVNISNDLIEVKLGVQTVILPDGTKVEPDGTVTEPDGLKYQPAMARGKVIGIQIFRPDGSKMQPGEIQTLQNGRKVQQPSF